VKKLLIQAMTDGDDCGLSAVGDVQSGEDGVNMIVNEPWKGEAI